MLANVYDSASSSDSSGDEEEQGAKRELPSPFDDGEDESTYGGNGENKRIRRIPHIEGNYACSIFLPCTSTDSEGAISELATRAVKRAREIWPTHEWEKLPVGSIHCSLSRTVMLKHHLIAPFKQKVAERLRSSPQLTMYVSPSAVDLFLSEDMSTAFLASPITEPGPVIAMIRAIDDVMADFDLEPFYDPPKPHLSLAWTTVDVKAICETIKSMADGDQHFRLPRKNSEGRSPDTLIGVDVDCVVVRIGPSVGAVCLRCMSTKLEKRTKHGIKKDSPAIARQKTTKKEKANPSGIEVERGPKKSVKEEHPAAVSQSSEEERGSVRVSKAKKKEIVESSARGKKRGGPERKTTRGVGKHQSSHRSKSLVSSESLLPAIDPPFAWNQRFSVSSAMANHEACKSQKTYFDSSPDFPHSSLPLLYTHNYWRGMGGNSLPTFPSSSFLLPGTSLAIHPDGKLTMDDKCHAAAKQERHSDRGLYRSLSAHLLLPPFDACCR
ncbi:hypothetical protein FOL47_010481 [Perkinsus chesapeaki]|uniref:U6 snRNA phosphodiesterase 1 n=1 Tax=Perkinsus chesapeaki TaxID=330153 RepID=A0A7J6L1P0_PERCH|nr:hypothetical protein FOL47_010481 [Perkinsus chesapeaki]